MVRKSTSFDPPESRSSYGARNDPPTIVNSTTKHNNKSTPKSSDRTSAVSSLIHRYEEATSPTGSAMGDQVIKENESRQSAASSTTSSSSQKKDKLQLVVQVDSEEDVVGSKRPSREDVAAATQYLTLSASRASSVTGSAAGRSTEDLPDSLFDLSLKPNTKLPAVRRSISKSSLQGPPSNEGGDVIIMPSTGSKKQTTQVVIENMPPHNPADLASHTFTPASGSAKVHTTPITSSQLDDSMNVLPSSGASASKTTYLTRKAHQFSSLKKKRNNNLLQKLFCSPDTTDGAKTPAGDERVLPVMEGPLSDQVDLERVDSGIKEEDEDPVESMRASNDEDEKAIPVDNKDWETGSSCLTFSDALDFTKDAFQLSAEADVRQSIQSAVAGALAAVSPSPAPLVRERKAPSPAKSQGENKEKIVKEVKSSNSQLNSKAESPAALSVSQKALETNRSSTTSVGSIATPTREKPKAVMATPSAAVPTPAEKSMFPSTIEYWEKIASARKTKPSKTPKPMSKSPRAKMIVMVEDAASTAEPTMEQHEVVLRETMSDERREPEHETQEDEEDQTNQLRSLSSSPVHETIQAQPSHDLSIVSAPSDEPNSKPSDSDDYDDDAFLPNSSVVTTPFKDQRFNRDTKEEKEDNHASSPMSRMSNIEEHTPKQNQAEMAHNVPATTKESPKHTSEELASRKEEVESIPTKNTPAENPPQNESDYQIRLDKALANHKVQAERLLQEHALQWKEEHEIEMKQIKSMFERKLLESKDQLSLANRKIKSQQEEVERLENDLKQKGEQPVSSTPTSIGNDRELQEKDEKHQKVVAAIQTELEKTKEELVQIKQLDEIEKKEDKATIDRLTEELALQKTQTMEVSAANQKVQELEQTVGALRTELKEAKENQSENQTTTLAVEMREQEILEKETMIEAREQAVHEAKKELEAVKEDISRGKLALEESVKELEDKQKAIDRKALDMETILTDIEDQKTQLEKSKKDFRAQKVEFETEKKMQAAQAPSTPTRSRSAMRSSSPLRTPSPSRVKSTSGIPRLTPKQEASERQALKTRVSELEAQVLEMQKAHAQAIQEIQTSSQQELLQVKEKMDAQAAEDTTELLRRIEQSETEDQREHALAIQAFTVKEEDLQAKIAMLEEQAATMSKEHENTLKELRKAGEGEIVRIKAEMEQRLEIHMARERELKDNLEQANSWDRVELLEKIEKLEETKNDERNGGLREVQRKEELLQRIDDLEKRQQQLVEEHEHALSELKQSSSTEIDELQQKLEQQKEAHLKREKRLSLSISETASYDKEDLLKKIEKLEADLDSERSAAQLIKMKITSLEKENKSCEAAHIEELAELQMKTSLEIRSLQSAVAGGGDTAKAFEIFQREKEELLEQVRNMESQLQTEQHERVDKLEAFREEHSVHVEKLKRESAAKLESADRRIEELKREHELKIEELEASYVAGKGAADQSDELLKLENKEKDLMLQIESLQTQVQDQKKMLEKQLTDIAESHAKELEDLIAQLDMVEAEHSEKLKTKERVAAQKDEIITALSNQLSEALDRLKSMEESATKATALQEEATRAQSQIATLTCELEVLKDTHEKFIVEANEIKDKACEQAREEMIERAEGQFRQANELYVKLKKQYDSSKEKVEKFSKELKEQKAKTLSMTREREENETKLKAELADLKAQYAQVEAQGAQKAKEYRREMEGLLKAAEDFEKQSKKAESKEKESQTKLTTALAEKDEAQKNYDSLMSENDELRRVCEELMVELEGR